MRVGDDIIIIIIIIIIGNIYVFLIMKYGSERSYEETETVFPRVKSKMFHFQVKFVLPCISHVKVLRYTIELCYEKA